MEEEGERELYRITSDDALFTQLLRSTYNLIMAMKTVYANTLRKGSVAIFEKYC